MSDIDMRGLTPTASMRGEDDEETDLLHDSLHEAADFLRSFKWCRGITESYFGLGVGGVVAVFLFRIDAPPQVDKWLWIVVGDLPPSYILTAEATTPLAALEIYCGLMQDWVEAVRGGRRLDAVVPVNMAPTPRNAAGLDTRVAFLRNEVMPLFMGAV